MVGLVLVSHSRKLVQALAELAGAVSQTPISIATAGGVGDDRAEFGTDATEIVESIRSVRSDGGVLVLVDLGSAVLSAQTALELMEDEERSSVTLCAGPLVEGAIVASAQIGAGSGREAVVREVLVALREKSSQLSAPEEPAPAPAAGWTSLGSTTTRVFTVTNPHGLHVRPAAKIVAALSSLDADITLRTPARGPVSARSFTGIATLGAVQGDSVYAEAAGRDAAAAIEALATLFAAGFGEAAEAGVLERSTSRPSGGSVVGASAAGTPVSGVAAAEGFGIAPLVVLTAGAQLVFGDEGLPPAVGGRAPTGDEAPSKEAPSGGKEAPSGGKEAPSGGGAESEVKKLLAACETARKETAAEREQARATAGADTAAILDGHIALLSDPEIIGTATSGIREKGLSAADSWTAAMDAVVTAFEGLPDEYQRQRSADARDAADRVRRILGSSIGSFTAVRAPSILAGIDVTPAQALRMDPKLVHGILLERGGRQSHSVIVARALGIPVIVGAQGAARIPPGTLVAMNGFNGSVEVDPPASRAAVVAEARRRWLQERTDALAAARGPAVTKDGKRIRVFANVTDASSVRTAMQNGAEGIGLVRTELLFARHAATPSEDEQTAILREIIEAAEGTQTVIRTFDAGADKPLPFLPGRMEANPALGLRGCRLTLWHREVFATQARAILRSGHGAQVRVLLPMVSTLEELEDAIRLFQRAHEELQARAVPHVWPVPLGIMVETPSAALLAGELAGRCAFLSIGTNDLTQYVMAAEREGADLGDLPTELQPAVLRSIAAVFRALHNAGRDASVCGEMASNTRLVPLLIGMGVDALSASPEMVAVVKQSVRAVSYRQASRLARRVLACGRLGDVQKALADAR